MITAMTQAQRQEVLPVEETVKRLMQDFRFRRMRHMVDHPESITDDDKVPDDLSRHAEAVAIVAAVRGAYQPVTADERRPLPPGLPAVSVPLDAVYIDDKHSRCYVLKSALTALDRAVPAGERDASDAALDAIARRCARPVRGCATDDQYTTLLLNIVEALRFASSARTALEREDGWQCKANRTADPPP